MPLTTDRALARRLELAEGRTNAAFVAARARVAPASGAATRAIDGTLAMFDGVDSPLTQSFGLGLHGDVADATLDALEAFFDERGADTHHETAPLGDPSLPARLQDRGYRVHELTSVLVADLAALVAREAPVSAVTARLVGADEATLWSATAAAGWGEIPGLDAFMRDLGHVAIAAEGTTCFLAQLDGVAVGTGTMSIHDGVVLLAGASTVPAWRARGAQAVLLHARLRHALEAGCDLAMMGAAPGSTSQGNAERRGLRMAYTRLKWRRAHPGGGLVAPR